MHPIIIDIIYLCRKNKARCPGKVGYPDDTTLITGIKDDLTELITKVKRYSEESGLYLNVKKTKVMTKCKLDHIIRDDN